MLWARSVRIGHRVYFGFWIVDCGFKKYKTKIFPSGSDFQSRFYDFNGLNEFNDFNGFNDLPVTVNCLPNSLRFAIRESWRSIEIV